MIFKTNRQAVETELIRGLYNFSLKNKGCVATIGNFDGVHLGHQALLSEVKKRAKALGVPSLVITFEPQPMEFFTRVKSVPRLTRFREKFSQLAQSGIDKVLVIRFNAEFAALTAEEFMEHLLSGTLGIKEIIVGDDFHFGKGRQGNMNVLKQAGEQLGFAVKSVQSVLIDNERVSSTRIRKALVDSDHLLAERLLGRPYSMLGRVVYGDQLGRTIGFPTANIYLHRQATPVHGIYVTRLYGITKKALPGVANVGIRPTVGGTRTLLEVHLFNFNQNIYGKYVCVEFCKKLRDEEHYETLDLMKEQILKDADEARHYFIQTGEIM